MEVIDDFYSILMTFQTVVLSNRQDPVWLTDVKCSKDTPPHLFHCEHAFKTNESECSGEYQHKNKVIQITCGKLS